MNTAVGWTFMSTISNSYKSLSICVRFGQTFGDTRALVLELVEGPTLADRIKPSRILRSTVQK